MVSKINKCAFFLVGFGAIYTWIREYPTDPFDKKTSRDYQKLLIDDKEYYRCLEIVAHAKKSLADSKMLTIINS